MRRTILKVACVALAAGFAAVPALAQQFPVKTVRVIIGFAPGGTTDVVGPPGGTAPG